MNFTARFAALAVLAVCAGRVAAGPLGSVTLDGDLGCDTLQTQRERLAALEIAVHASMAKARGEATPEVLRAGDAATAKFTDLSRQRCRKLAGPFDVLQRQATPGGSIVRVRFGEDALWVLMR
jgi:hypothetical protein